MPRSPSCRWSDCTFHFSVSNALLVCIGIVCLSPNFLMGQDPFMDPPEVEVDQANPGALPRMNRAQLEEYMYGSLGGSKQAFQKAKRENIRRELDRIHSICSLSEKQWTKLNEAIDVDIQHIESRINSMLSSFDAKMTNQQLQEMQSKVWQFAATIQSEKVEPNAVWHKVLCSQLTKEQRDKIEADEEVASENQAKTDLLRSLLSLQRKLGLNARQRVKISEWLSQVEHRELSFPSICKTLRKSPIAAEVVLGWMRLSCEPGTANSVPIWPS